MDTPVSTLNSSSSSIRSFQSQSLTQKSSIFIAERLHNKILMKGLCKETDNCFVAVRKTLFLSLPSNAPNSTFDGENLSLKIFSTSSLQASANSTFKNDSLMNTSLRHQVNTNTSIPYWGESPLSPALKQPTISFNDAFSFHSKLTCSADDFVIRPDAADNFFADYIKGFNAFYFVIVSSNTIRGALNTVPVQNQSIILKENVDENDMQEFANLQILPSIKHIHLARKHQYAALLREENCLAVWSDSDTMDQVFNSIQELDKKLFQVVWEGIEQKPEINDSDDVEDIERQSDESSLISDKVSEVNKDFAVLREPPYVDLELNFFTRRTFSVLSTIFVTISLFSPLNRNSNYYSIIPPPRKNLLHKQIFQENRKGKNMSILPHVTIQIPVYTEGLMTVIDPTIKSIKKAMSTYEKQGGTASIFVNDDGMQVIPETEAYERQVYYARNDIGWIARPKLNRAGRFKKASNLNYCLNISKRVRDEFEICCTKNSKSDSELMSPEQCLYKVFQEEFPDAMGAGDVIIGEFILLVDADTRVPEDCFLDSVNEFLSCPEVAILQHDSSVLYVTNNFWEKAIGHFTKMTYLNIRFMSACGDVCPFVGHNAFLRMDSLEEISTVDSLGRIKYWSESHVSEDFEVSLKLQSIGYVVRFVAYSKGKFQEGVSLTVYDEINRWKKYAFGCSELTQLDQLGFSVQ
ncbi:hypothetical protein HK099_001371 [Clydaea vesicula]|uniref:Glycosyltransferase 2-like domain-containing protein n=1 Tax=Clydaea vesicula TaxID=447962 RepID=A0AAD5XX54_9FUNG|nr:hypothetical protein HK099_001371 [Clydaea vesicula]